MSFAVPQFLTRGPGVWKLNVYVLVEEDIFLLYALSGLLGVRGNLILTVMDWWQVAKSKIKGLWVTYCKNRAARLRSRRDFVVRLVSHLKGGCTGVALTVLTLIRRLSWVEEVECSLSYFCKLEKMRRCESGITALRNPDNVVHTGGGGIQSVVFLLCRPFFEGGD